MTIRIFVCIFLCASANFLAYSQGVGVRINEFQTSNLNTIADEDQTYPDWIELYNASTQAVNLKGWSLTDDATLPGKWLFQDLTIAPGAYLLVFASGKDRALPGSPIHTNFKLSADGEYLALCPPTRKPVSEWNPYVEMVAGQSFGWLNGGWGIFKTPTPGRANSGGVLLRYPDPVFSQPAGFYEAPFDLILSSAVSSARIYYTNDGSEPSALNGRLYSGPIRVSGTSVIRAKVVPLQADTMVGSPVVTRTYLYIDDVLKQSNTPVGYPTNWGKYSQFSGTSIADYEMDPELTAESAYASKIRQGLLDLPIVSLVTDKNNLFSNVPDSVTGGIYMFTGPPTGDRTGRGWERPVSFEYISKRDAVYLHANAGIEIHGGHSRLPEKCPKHSFNIDFKSQYGPSKLYYPLYGSSEAPNVNKLVLRAGFGNTWLHQTSTERTIAVYARDEWSKRTQKQMGQPASNLRYVHLFINGIYWGLYNATEPLDEDFCENYLGGDESEYDVVESSEVDGGTIATNGDLTAWNQLFTMVKDTSDLSVFYKIQGLNLDGTLSSTYPALLDMENFMDYLLMNFYGGNTDWDHHNWVAVRNRVQPGKGYKFLSWDAEHMLKSVTQNLLALNNPKCPTYLFQYLRKNPHFRRMWADRVQKWCFNNGYLAPTAAAQTFTSLTDQIENSLYAESARWGDYRKDVHKYTSAGQLYRKDTHFDPQKKWMLETYFPQRTDNFVSQLKSAGLYPNVEAPEFRLNGSPLISDSVKQGDLLSMSSTSAKIYYTTTGNDPVKWALNGSGTLDPAALLYSSPLTPDRDYAISARALLTGTWSALSEQLILYRSVTDLYSDAVWKPQIKLSNYPNPFSDRTTFTYSLPFEAHVRLDIVDVSGRLVETLLNVAQSAGAYEQVFEGRNLPRGMYLCRFKVQGGNDYQCVLKIGKL